MDKFSLACQVQFADDANGTENKVTNVKISGLAYSGEPIQQMFGRTIVDVSGMEFAPQIPLMDSHENTLTAKLGEVNATVKDNQVFIEGNINSKSAYVQNIIEQGKLSNWQLSIGASILDAEFVKAQKTVEVNGKTVEGPIVVIRKSLLREVSVVAIGADKNANMTIEASWSMTGNNNFNFLSNPLKGGLNMAENIKNNVEPVADVNANEPEKNNTTAAPDVKAVAEEAIKMERKRVADITAICGNDCPDIQATAIAEGWDVNRVTAEVLKKVRADRPNVGINVNTGVHAVGKNEMECALCMRLGMSEDSLQKSYGEATVEAASKICDISLKEVIRESVKMSGGAYSTVGTSDEDIRAAFSSVSLPGILSNVANKVMLKSYEAVNPVAFKLCSTGSLTDFKESNRYRLTDMGDLQQVAPDGNIQDGGLTEEHATNQIDTYGKKFCLTRKMIIDDDLNAFAKIPAMMGQRAAKLVDKLFFARLLANPAQGDGKTLFSTEHSNLLSDGGAFSKASLQKAIEMFENQKDADGQPISVTARKLLVPTALKFAAQELLGSALMLATGSTDALKPAKNILADLGLEVISSPYLTNANDWYLFGDPSEVDTFEIGFLKGKRTPTIQQGETDFNTLGMWFRVYFDLGVREQDFRGMVKAIGA